MADDRSRRVRVKIEVPICSGGGQRGAAKDYLYAGVNCLQVMTLLETEDNLNSLKNGRKLFSVHFPNRSNKALNRQ